MYNGTHEQRREETITTIQYTTDADITSLVHNCRSLAVGRRRQQIL